MAKALRILLIEDSEVDAELLMLELERSDYTIFCQRVDTLVAVEAAVQSAAEVTTTAESSWDVILADYRLPQFTAIAALRLVQAYRLDIPFIIVSGSIGEETAVAAMKAGVHDYLMKDNLARLLPAIDRELREAQIRRERYQATRTLEYQAFHDGLTQLPNRVSFLQTLQRQIEAGDAAPFAVLYIEIDRYQTIQYSLGHALSERLLVAIAQRLQTCLARATYDIATSECIARIGTDEFAVLLCPVMDDAAVLATSQNLQDALNSPFEIDGFTLYTTTSIGIAPSNLSYVQAEDYLRVADTAKHHARLRGGGQTALFTQEMQIQAVERLELEYSLQQAIRQQQLQLYYQPIVQLQTGQLTGFEALARWYHTPRGWVSPATFIPIAEEMGLIGELGQWVLETACQQLQTWQHQFPHISPLEMSVNLSVRQLVQPGLAEQIGGVLQRLSLPNEQIHLEITESALMESVETAIALLEQLRTQNIRFALDDFGTGYSSLSYLTTLPIHILKIDRTFVSSLDADARNRQVVQAVITLAQNLGMEVVAEGIETQAQWDLLREMDCPLGQGYFFSPPVSAAAIELMLAQLQGS